MHAQARLEVLCGGDVEAASGQPAHRPDPVTSLYVPAGHAVQLSALSCSNPRSQVQSTAATLPFGEKLSDPAQGVQAPGPEKLLNVPLWHKPHGSFPAPSL